MSERDELAALGGSWRGITDHAAFSVPAALRRRRRQTALFVVEAVGCGLLLLLAVLFWLAGDGVVYRVSAAVFFVCTVFSGVITARTRVALGRWADWTPEGVLAFRVRECDVSLLNAKLALVSAAVLAVFAGFVWAAAELEWDVLPPEFHYFYAAVVAVSVLAACGWAVWQIPRKRRDRARFRALLEELREP